ncbi:hypothetical protein [Prevotellamassilia timonensis]|uniref:hypothetical protein n=1 Tax=Prevotellamassilia timonensis TaxID=1852370 RepID=UPI000AF9D5F6
MKRGGSWNNNARNCRSSNRNNNTPGNRNNNLGLRLVLSQLRIPQNKQGYCKQADILKACSQAYLQNRVSQYLLCEHHLQAMLVGHQRYMAEHFACF